MALFFVPVGPHSHGCAAPSGSKDVTCNMLYLGPTDVPWNQWYNPPADGPTILTQFFGGPNVFGPCTLDIWAPLLDPVDATNDHIMLCLLGPHKWCIIWAPQMEHYLGPTNGALFGPPQDPSLPSTPLLPRLCPQA